MIYEAIDRLVRYGLETGLIDQSERVYSRNRILDVMRADSYTQSDISDCGDLSDILGELCDIAVRRGLCADTTESRDIFDTRLMNCLTPRPSQLHAVFGEKLRESPEAATQWYYKLSCDSNYIRRDRIARDRKWKYSSKYGELDITINLSKPEKDPRDIAAALSSRDTDYPKCQLCIENEGYAGRIGHPARANHRIIPITLTGDSYNLQYSPYVYYNEHCIVFNSEHVPMKVDEAALSHLLDFVRLFPLYFIGSNADLPIVGGSILTHDHFQGGRYTFAMERAGIEENFEIKGYEDVQCGIVRWPLSVIRISHADPERLVDLASYILDSWRAYTDESAYIFAHTDGVPHNTITPIARRRGESYELDLCLRNNITTPEHPMGLYHPHEELHHIKKENIGLIEVMGLAVLPARLDRELRAIEDCILCDRDITENEELRKHAAWLSGFLPEMIEADRESVRRRLEQEVGRVFEQVLEDAGVFKNDENGRRAFRRFIATL